MPHARLPPRHRATSQTTTPSCLAPRSAGPACAVYIHLHVHALQDLLVPLRLWMDVDLGIAVDAAC